MTGSDLRWIQSRPAWAPYLHQMPTMTTVGFRMNTQRKPFDDRRVRQALNYAVDKRRIERLMTGTAVAAHGTIPPGVLGRDDTLAPYPHDPEKARALLREAGYPDGFRVSYVTLSDEEAEKIAVSLKHDLARVGVEIDISLMTLSAWLEAISKPTGAPFSTMGWTGDFPDPTSLHDPLFHSRNIGENYATNYAFYKNAELDALLDARGDVPPRRAHHLRRRAVDLRLPPGLGRGHAALRARLQTASDLGARLHVRVARPRGRRKAGGAVIALRRIGWTLVVIWFVVTLTFLMVVALPSDPAKTLLGPRATKDAIERVNAHYCFDESIPVQYGCWIGNLVRGDLGESYRSRKPVTELLGERLWPTLQLAIGAIVLQLLIGVPLGMWAAVRKRRWPDRAVGWFALVAQSAPTFVVGTVLLYVVAYRWGALPLGGYGEGVLDRLAHLILPSLTLATAGIAYYARITRNELVDILGQDYVRTARAKGLPERTVLARHALRPAMPPLLTLVGLDLGILAGGAVVVETVFAWPGLGREMLLAILEVDLPVILGITLVTAIAVALANLAVDLVHVWIDPRVRKA
jgi:peptide/nickel transport system permease protein